MEEGQESKIECTLWRRRAFNNAAPDIASTLGVVAAALPSCSNENDAPNNASPRKVDSWTKRGAKRKFPSRGLGGMEYCTRRHRHCHRLRISNRSAASHLHCPCSVEASMTASSVKLRAGTKLCCKVNAAHSQSTTSAAVAGSGLELEGARSWSQELCQLFAFYPKPKLSSLPTCIVQVSGFLNIVQYR